MTPAAAKRVLVVEDEESFREILQIGLIGEGFDCSSASGVAEAKALLEAQDFDAVVSDLRLKDGSGLDLLAWMKQREFKARVVIMTAFATTETTVQALNLGAVDFLTKARNDMNELTKVLKGLFVESPAQEAMEAVSAGDLVGVGDTIRRVQALVGKVARADTTVLVTGESGTGKEIVARLIHRFSDRASGPFIPVNCGALPENLLESELFGYEKGAFTGASATKRGLFEESSGGFLFLDEIGEMPLPLQVKLLRVLQERRVRRVGGTDERPVDVRVIGATNRNLRDLVDKGKFREDLYYRLNILHIELPPLRERQEDLPVLVDYFLRRFSQKLGRAPMVFGAESLTLLRSYRFPGNVRELENLVERCVALNAGGPIGPDLFPDAMLREIQAAGPVAEAFPPAQAWAIPEAGFDLEAWLNALRGHYLKAALLETGGNKTKASRRLGMSFRAYRYWAAHLGGLEGLPGRLPLPAEHPAPEDPGPGDEPE
jgi:two-component system response regulator PilR (NtrC family)